MTKKQASKLIELTELLAARLDVPVDIKVQTFRKSYHLQEGNGLSRIDQALARVRERLGGANMASYINNEPGGQFARLASMIVDFAKAIKSMNEVNATDTEAVAVLAGLGAMCVEAIAYITEHEPLRNSESGGES